MLNVITHGAITELNLARAPANALDTALVTAIGNAFDEAVKSGSRGIILSGTHGMFSAGVDVPSLLADGRDGVRAFWTSFFATGAKFALSPVPVAAAITGHSPAGGAVLSLLCDYRVMAEGNFRIGLNEVQVGLTVPECIQLALRRVVGTHRAERLLVAGAMIDSAQAHAIGYVDELAPVDQVVARARHWLDGMLALPANAMLGTRAIARADITGVWSQFDKLPIDQFVDGFYSPETQAVLQQLVARLKKKD